MCKAKKCVTVLILLLLGVQASLFAAGNRDKGLPRVDQLIRERNYNEAVYELALYLQEKPDDFDGAMRRVQRIIKMRRSYNAAADQLLRVLVDDPTNDAKKLEMIAFLESLEPNPNPNTTQFIRDTKSAAQFTFYRARFEEIMTGGAALIDSGRYIEAARLFTDGFIVYKVEYDEETEDRDEVARVNAELAIIRNSLSALEPLAQSIQDAVAAYVQATGLGDTLAAQTAVTRLTALIDQYAPPRNQVVAAGWLFEDLFAAARDADPLLTENSFLPFAWRFTMGRRTVDRFEGVAGALDALWSGALDRMQAGTDQAIRRYWLAAYNQVMEDSSGSSTALAEGLNLAAGFAVLGARVSDLSGRFITRDGMILQRDRTSEVARYNGLGQLVDALRVASVLYNDYFVLEDAFNTYQPPSPVPATAGDRNVAALVEYNRLFTAMNDLASRVQSLPLPEQGAAPDDYFTELNAYRSRVQSTFDQGRSALVLASADYRSRAADVLVQDRREEFNRARGLLEGVRQDGTDVLLYYPSESVTAFNALRTRLSADRTALLAHRSDMEGFPAAFRTLEPFRQSVASVDNAVAAVDRMNTDSANLITQANSRVLQATVARQEADLRYNQALAALGRNDFQTARDNLNRSSERTVQALTLQESASYRALTDTRLQQLGSDINRTENEFVVREVRALITSGRNFYFTGNFDQAEQVLLQARNRWAVTNIERNSEVENWLGIINTALSVKSGRSIPVSAPLYPQLSQLLSSANQLFAEGSEQFRRGQRTAAIQTLNSAKDKLRQVLLVEPRNQDAGQLILRIDQLIDPAAFDDMFRQKVANARATYRTDGQAVYAELLDLAQINPRWPGIQALIEEVERFLGIRIPPPDPRALAESNRLTQEARRVYDSNIRTQFPVAIAQLDEAIRLNPDNQAAINLKDRLQTASGGGAVAVLTAAAEAQYNRAVRELQNGNTIIAAALVDDLLRDPRNASSSKIQELKRRIDSLR